MDTVTHQMFLAIISIADLVFTPHTTRSPRNVKFFLIQSPIWYLIGPTFLKESSGHLSDHFQDHQFFTEESAVFMAAFHLSLKHTFPSHRILIYKQDDEQMTVQKCRSRLH